MKRLVYAMLLTTALALPSHDAMADWGKKDSRYMGKHSAAREYRVDSQGRAIFNLKPAKIGEVQAALDRKGYYDGRVDGIWGPRTTAAIQQFQRDNGLDVTGNLDMRTLNRLDVGMEASRKMPGKFYGYDAYGRPIRLNEKQTDERWSARNHVQAMNHPDHMTGSQFKNTQVDVTTPYKLNN